MKKSESAKPTRTDWKKEAEKWKAIAEAYKSSLTKALAGSASNRQFVDIPVRKSWVQKLQTWYHK